MKYYAMCLDTGARRERAKRARSLCIYIYIPYPAQHYLLVWGSLRLVPINRGYYLRAALISCACAMYGYYSRAATVRYYSNKYGMP